MGEGLLGIFLYHSHFDLELVNIHCNSLKVIEMEGYIEKHQPFLLLIKMSIHYPFTQRMIKETRNTCIEILFRL